MFLWTKNKNNFYNQWNEYPIICAVWEYEGGRNDFKLQSHPQKQEQTCNVFLQLFSKLFFAISCPSAKGINSEGRMRDDGRNKEINCATTVFPFLRASNCAVGVEWKYGWIHLIFYTTHTSGKKPGHDISDKLC